ncbi:hypothetical protein Rsub_11814 [Raphidocelis subcapitata]|uniref:Uncharacterized protein n=1 Tax=Raphidocelis subcapitata TaxID=307507 RepID=A0A2V0PMA5_9CHLO|nr:hypothetical protein Rsub_11814 [Raphidocelis subcapitata]|eukprot:GBF99010.1 hypothetical protein Rsub_11814 [Raphidocelis subcapitata]
MGRVCGRGLLLLALLAAAGPPAARADGAAPPAATVAVRSEHAQVQAGRPAKLEVRVADGASKAALPPSDFQLSHERLIHMVVLGADLDTFFHTHQTSTTPEAFVFSAVTFPKAGDYLLSFDGETKDDVAVSSRAKLAAAGAPKMAAFDARRVGATTVSVRPAPLADPSPAVSLASLSAPAGSGAGAGPVYEAALDGPQGAACSPGARPQAYTLKLSRREAGAKGGGGGAAAPVTDLEAYLGAPMHLATISSDLKSSGHTHGTLPKAAAAGAASKPAPAAAAAADEHAAHGRRLAGSSRRSLAQAAGGGGGAHGGSHDGMDMDMDMAGMDMGGDDKTPAAPSPSGGAAGAAQHAQHAAPAGARFGPVILAEAPMPRAGVYALVAQLRRGKELILLPFYVNCSGPAQ